MFLDHTAHGKSDTSIAGSCQGYKAESSIHVTENEISSGGLIFIDSCAADYVHAQTL